MMTSAVSSGNAAPRPAIPVANLEAERAVLAALIRNPDPAPILQLGITPELFASADCRAAFAAINQCLLDGTQPDAALLRSALDPAALIEVETSLREHASAANLPGWVSILKACRRERAVRAARNRLALAASDGAPDHELSAIVESIRQAATGGPDEAQPPRFLWAEDFCKNEALEDDLVDGYFPAGSVGVVFGDSEAYKSFLLIDVCGHIATGRPWRGREVKQGKVLFIAGEGGNGLKTRIAAWFERHGEPMRNFAVSTVPLELCDPKNADLLIAEIRRFIGGESFSLIVLDTLNTHFGPGDENATVDMTRFRVSVVKLGRATGATVAISHHCGLADKGRGRGSISLRNGIDWEFKLERSGDYTTLTGTKTKDRSTPPPLSWKLVQQPLPWADKKGKPIDGAVLEPADSVMRPNNSKLSRPNRIALDALNAAIQAGDDHALIADWRSAALAAGITHSESRQGKHAAFNRAVDALVDACLVRVDGHRCYPAATNPSIPSTTSTKRQHVDAVDAGIGASTRQQKTSTTPPLYRGVDVVDVDARPKPEEPKGNGGDLVPADTMSSHHPDNGGDESTEALALKLANEAGLDVGRMMTGDLDDSGWSRLANASTELGARQPDDRPRLALLVEAIDKAGAAGARP